MHFVQQIWLWLEYVAKIPFDDTVSAMYKVGKSLPSALRETAMGGVAVTKAGLELRKKVFGEE